MTNKHTGQVHLVKFWVPRMTNKHIQVNFSGSIMPLRVIQHYSDWVCTAVMSNDLLPTVMAPNSRYGFIAQLVEHCTGIAEVTGSNPAEA